MARADPHCHTFASDGMVTPAELVDAAVKARLDLIAVTDHDTISSVRETQERGEAAGLIVVPGQEVTTAFPANTHLLAWFVSKPLKRGMSLDDTVSAIHEQGALAIVPHPFMPLYFGSIQPWMLRRLIEKHTLDGIEIMHTVPIGSRRRRLLDEFYATHRERLGAALGGSDSHFGAHDIACIVTEYQGDFRSAVERKETEPRWLRRRQVPGGVAARQQWRALVEVPLRRLRGEL